MSATTQRVIGSVYLLHFDPPFKHARHYLGWSASVAERVATHRMGRGSPLVRAALAAGCNVRLVRVWGRCSRILERHLKNQKNAPRLCPCCSGNSWAWQQPGCYGLGPWRGW